MIINFSMVWDPAVLKKYGTTSQFRLLNEVRSELRNNPLSRHKDGALNLVFGRKGSAYRAPAEGRGSQYQRATRVVATPANLSLPDPDLPAGDSSSFRDRLRAIDMR